LVWVGQVGKENMWVVEELVVMVVAANKSCRKKQRALGAHLEERNGHVEVRYVRGDR